MGIACYLSPSLFLRTHREESPSTLLGFDCVYAERNNTLSDEVTTVGAWVVEGLGVASTRLTESGISKILPILPISNSEKNN